MSTRARSNLYREFEITHFVFDSIDACALSNVYKPTRACYSGHLIRSCLTLGGIGYLSSIHKQINIYNKSNIYVDLDVGTLIIRSDFQLRNPFWK